MTELHNHFQGIFPIVLIDQKFCYVAIDNPPLVTPIDSDDSVEIVAKWVCEWERCCEEH